LQAIFALSAEFPNLTGALMDDFFRNDPGAPGRFSAEQVAGFRCQLHAARRPLELYVVVSAHDLDLLLRQHLDAVDAITFWTWHAKDLDAMEHNFCRLEELAPQPRKLPGLYMWDFGACAPMPMAAMEHQCRLGFEWLKSGHVASLIFLASCLVDLALESVEYARRLIEHVGDEPLRHCDLRKGARVA
jgi:hypothetical protein